MKLFKQKKEVFENSKDISNLAPNDSLKEIFILGNGPSLNEYTPDQLKDRFIIGTNRSWLWGKSDLLIWRDQRISEELDFFEIEKDNTLWLAGEPALNSSKVNFSDSFLKNIDYRFNDDWKDQYIGKGIKWNGIIFHALAIAKHLSPDAEIHLLGVDLGVKSEMHHFFNIYHGFNMGIYKSGWQEENFHYKKRLEMMVKNFEKLKERDFKIINHSKESRLTELFGYEKL